MILKSWSPVEAHHPSCPVIFDRDVVELDDRDIMLYRDSGHLVTLERPWCTHVDRDTEYTTHETERGTMYSVVNLPSRCPCLAWNPVTETWDRVSTPAVVREAVKRYYGGEIIDPIAGTPYALLDAARRQDEIAMQAMTEFAARQWGMDGPARDRYHAMLWFHVDPDIQQVRASLWAFPRPSDDPSLQRSRIRFTM